MISNHDIESDFRAIAQNEVNAAKSVANKQRALKYSQAAASVSASNTTSSATSPATNSAEKGIYFNAIQIESRLILV